MFTGIIEETGTVRSFVQRDNGAVVEIQCDKVLKDRHVGASLAVNGACLTLTQVGPQGFRAEVSTETLRCTAVDRLRAGKEVNLERPVQVGERLEGHMVTGHVDGVGKVRSIRPAGEFLEISYLASPDILRYVVEKGSIAVDGISLTVARVEGEGFGVAVIPETVRRTNVAALSVGDAVNIECDLIGKYVERILEGWKGQRRGVTIPLLEEHGYL